MFFSKDLFINQATLDKIRFFFILIFFFLAVVQVAIIKFDLSYYIILLGMIILSIININIILNKENIFYFFFHILTIFFSFFFYIFSPLLFKTIYLESLFLNLEMPKESFISIMIFQLIIIFSFLFHKRNFQKKKQKSFYIFQKMSVFNNLDKNKTYLLFFLIFILKLFLNLIDQGSTAFTEYGNILMKFLYGFEVFFYLPIILVYALYFNKKLSRSKFFLFILFYIIISFFFGLTTNSRSEIMHGIYIILICLIMKFVNNPLILNRKDKFILTLSFAIFILVLNFVSKQILENRTYRSSLTPLELIKYYNFSTKPNKEDNQYLLFNAEYYLPNNVINRMTAIKYFDKNNWEAQLLSARDRIDFKNFSFNRMLSILPQNIINLFDKDFKKIDYLISNGSYIERKARLRDFGDFNTGSFIVELYLITNSKIFSYCLIAIFFILFFSILSKFQYYRNDKIFFSPLIILISYNLINFPTSDNITGIINQILRQPIQLIFLYFLFNYFFIKKNMKMKQI